jgi:hypothetical protein
MSVVSTTNRPIAIWISPFVGAFAVALFLMIRALLMPESVGAFAAFFVWFIERAAVGYICALPLMGIAYRLGLRHMVGFMLLASLAAFPLEHYTSTPINAWHPTEEEIDHGFYWDTFIPCILLASATGVLFSLGVTRKKKADQVGTDNDGAAPHRV